MGGTLLAYVVIQFALYGPLLYVLLVPRTINPRQARGFFLVEQIPTLIKRAKLVFNLSSHWLTD